MIRTYWRGGSFFFDQKKTKTTKITFSSRMYAREQAHALFFRYEFVNNVYSPIASMYLVFVELHYKQSLPVFHSTDNKIANLTSYRARARIFHSSYTALRARTHARRARARTQDTGHSSKGSSLRSVMPLPAASAFARLTLAPISTQNIKTFVF